MLDRITKFAGLASIASATVALIALAISAAQISRDLRSATIREWQEVTVYSIVSEAALPGLTFSDIQTKYKNVAPDFGSELPVSEINTQSLKRTLLALMSKRAITLRPDGRYGVAIDPVSIEAIRASEISARMQKIGDALVEKTSKEPAKHTFMELQNFLNGKQLFTEEEFQRLTANMVRQGYFVVSQDGKVSPSIDSLGRPVPSKPK